MALTTNESNTIENRFVQIEEALNEVQTAMNNLVNRRTLLSLLNIRQNEITELQTAVSRITQPDSVVLLNSHMASTSAHSILFAQKSNTTHTHDDRYYRENEFINTSTGSSDAGKPIVLDANGLLDSTLIEETLRDHSVLSGLDDDDHTQYLNNTRGDARYYTRTLLDNGQLDSRYFAESEFINTTSGIGDAGKPIVLGVDGRLDPSFVELTLENHSTLSGLDSDDHTQYHTDARGDARYYTQAQVDTIASGINHGDLDNIGTDDHHPQLHTVASHSDTTATGAELETLTDGNDASSLHIHDHTTLSNKGTNTHAQIDTHIADSTLHFLESAIDHGTISGLADDDHTQYHNDTRGDIRYYTKTQVDTIASGINHGDLENLTNDDHGQYTLRTDWSQNGFENLTDSTISWTDSTPDRTLSIQPTGTSFNYFINGVKYTSTGATVQISDTAGIHAIYFNSAGSLVSTANPTIVQMATIIESNAFVSIIYWNSTNQTAIYVGEERHGISMSPSSHAYLHFTEGCRYVDGLGLNTINADGVGATADAQFGVDSGRIVDEDLLVAISSITSTTGLPIYYMLGASAEWFKYTESGFSCRTFDGTSSTRLAWNEYTGGAWQLTQVVSGRYVLYHIFATTEKDNPMISVMGQDTYLSLNAARAGATSEIRSLVLDDVLFPEIKPIATVIFQTNLSYASAVNARIVSTEEGDDYIDFRNEQISRVVVSTTDHGSLTGLADDDHTQYHNDTRGDVRYYTKTQVDTIASGINHGDLENLTNDDHSQYTLLAGRSGGQTLYGGTGSGDDLTLHSTSNATKGSIFFGANSAYDGVNNRLGIGITTADGTLHVHEGTAGSVAAPSNSNLVVESDDAGNYLSFLSPNTATQGIYFGDADDNDIGGILYAHPTNALSLRTSNSNRLTITGSTGIDISLPVTITAASNTEQLIIKAHSAQTNANPLVQLQDSVGGIISSFHSDNNTNVFIGYLSGNANTVSGADGTRNIFIGYACGRLNVDGTGNIALGVQGNENNVSGDYNTAVGYKSLLNNTSNYNLGIGAFSFTANTTGTNNLGIGYYSGGANQDGEGNICIGAYSNLDNVSGDYNIAIGYFSLFENTASSNTAIGAFSLYNNTTGTYNCGIGRSALYTNQTGNRNLSIGFFSLYYTTGSDNSAIGYEAAKNLAGGNNNTCIGTQAGHGTSGQAYSNNCLIGYKSAYSLTTGSNNLCICYQSGYALTSGGNNVLLGYQAGNNITTGGSNIIIGASVTASAADVSNELNIGDVIYGDTVSGFIGIGSEPETTFDIDGDSVRVRTSQSPASDGAGRQGEIAWDSDYLYVCTSHNTWKRVALTGGY